MVFPMLEDRILVWVSTTPAGSPCTTYDKYRASFLTLAVALLGDLTTAEDVVQDVFLSLVRLSAG